MKSILTKRNLYREILNITHDGHRNSVNDALDIVSDGLLVAHGGNEYNAILRAEYPEPVSTSTLWDVDAVRINALLDLIDLADD